MSAPEINQIWSETKGDPRVTVAILDGPVDLSHPCFDPATNLVQLNTVETAISTSGIAKEHGTHVASIVFGRHENGIKGIAPGCSGLLIPIFSDEMISENVSCSQVKIKRRLLILNGPI
ncbi:MAG: S8 family serine peptidase [Candidatus Dadabacteria bacterium]|nr:S8 family serine peptidase [Candidatus Dadabacteria bacterium]